MRGCDGRRGRVIGEAEWMGEAWVKRSLAGTRVVLTGAAQVRWWVGGVESKWVRRSGFELHEVASSAPLSSEGSAAGLHVYSS